MFEAFVEAVSILATMQQNGWFMGGLDRYYTTTFADANAAFASGEAAMKIEGTWWLPNVDLFWGRDSGNDNDWDWAPVPSKSGKPTFTLGMGSLAVNAKTEHPDEAAAFIDFLFSQDSVAKWLVEAKYFVPVQFDASAVDVDPVTAQIVAVLQSDSGAQFGYNIDVMAPPAFNDMMQNGFQAVLAGDKTAEQQAADLQAAWEKGMPAADATPTS